VAQLRILSGIGLVAFFGIWTLIAVSGLVQPQFLPTPWAVAQQFIELTQRPFVGYTLQTHLLSSLGRFAMGFGLAAAVGVPLGLAMGWFRTLDAIVSPLFDALRFVAPIAWVPFAALWFGTGIGVHPAVGYLSFSHLAPALLGAGLFTAGIAMTFNRMWFGLPKAATQPD